MDLILDGLPCRLDEMGLGAGPKPDRPGTDASKDAVPDEGDDE